MMLFCMLLFSLTLSVHGSFDEWKKTADNGLSSVIKFRKSTDNGLSSMINWKKSSDSGLSSVINWKKSSDSGLSSVMMNWKKSADSDLSSVSKKEWDRWLIRSLSEEYSLGYRLCELYPALRHDCGYFGIDEDGCNRRGCCYTTSQTTGVSWCYFARDMIEDQCMFTPGERTACGEYGVDKETCLAEGCCWQPRDNPDIPWCYHALEEEEDDNNDNGGDDDDDNNGDDDDDNDDYSGDDDGDDDDDSEGSGQPSITTTPPPEEVPLPTDAETCPPDFHDYGNGICYSVSNTAATFDTASENCQTLHESATLVLIHSEEEKNFIHNNVRPAGNQYWIGMRRICDGNYNGCFEWVDGTSLVYSNWWEGEPNSHHEGCVEAIGDIGSLWNDVPCGASLPYVCELDVFYI